MRSTDWAQTPVGAATGWPQSVRALVRIMLTSRYAMWMGWGADLTFFYNDAYAARPLGAKHPWALGRPAREVWAEIWDDIGPRIERVLTTGRGDLGRGAAALPRAQRLSRGDLPHVLLQPAARRRRHASRACSASSPRRPSGSSASGGSPSLRELGAAARGAARRPTTCAARPRARAARADAARPAVHADLPVRRPTAERALVGAHWHRRRSRAAATPVDVATSRGRPVGRRRAGRAVAVSRSMPLRRARPGRRARGDAPAARRSCCRSPSRARPRPAGVFVAGAQPATARSTTRTASFLGAVRRRRSPPALANARAYEEERRRAEALAELDRAKTDVLLERQPRVPHAADADARPARGRARRRRDRALARRRRSRPCTATRCGCCKLVNTLLDFSRIEAGRVEALLRAGRSGARSPPSSRARSARRSSAPGCGCVVDCRAAAPSRCIVDRDMWEKIVLNLLSNAFKFTLRGRDRASRCARDGRSTSGSPCATPASASRRDELPRLFERFHRVEGARGRTHEGTGIGLALVQELVRAARRHRSRSTSELGTRHDVHRRDPARRRAPAGRRDRGTRRAGDRASARGRVRCRRRCAGCPATPRRPPSRSPAAEPATARPSGAHPRSPTTTPTCASYLRRLLARALGASTAVADGAAALAAVRARRPTSCSPT